MKRLISLLTASFLFCVQLNALPFVTAELMGQLGNQMFIIAATVSLALDHGAMPVFPDLIESKKYNIPLNYERLFYDLPVRLPKSIDFIYKESSFSYKSIPYRKNMKIIGYFQSEKYFFKHKQEILNLFAPPPVVIDYLSSRYADILEHPIAVSIHVRFYHEDPTGTAHPTCTQEYFQKAMEYFPQDALYAVFSNNIEKSKSLFWDMDKNIRFIEGEDRFCDLYLMSLCKHNIIANSSFSWWGAYLNGNPNKQVIAPKLWFNPAYESDLKDLLPEGWIRI